MTLDPTTRGRPRAHPHGLERTWTKRLARRSSVCTPVVRTLVVASLVWGTRSLTACGEAPDASTGARVPTGSANDGSDATTPAALERPHEDDARAPALGPAERQTAVRALLGVMEPSARGFVLVAAPLPWSAERLADTFALPEDARDLLELAEDVDWTLAQRYGDDAPARLFHDAQWLAFRPSVVGEPILVRYAPSSPGVADGSTAPRGRAFFRDVMASDFDEGRVTGTDKHEPKARFPWRVVWLSDDVVAFVSMREIGTGTSPLTAGRDLPFTGIRADLERELGDEGIVLLLATGGPSMHLLLPEWILRTRLRVTRWQEGHDVEVGLELPTSEAADLAARVLDDGGALDGAPIPDTLLELHRTVAFTSQAAVVEGRLQLTPEMAAPLRAQDEAAATRSPAGGR